MTTKLTLRLRETDVRALNAAAVNIAGPAGAPYLTKTAIFRAAIEALNARGAGATSGRDGQEAAR